MSRYVAFLRGMNLGGRRISNGELCACFEAAGLQQVCAFLASGNVIFDTSRKPRGGLARFLEAELDKRLGYAVPTFLRTAAEVRAVAAHQPFPGARVAASSGKLQVALLTGEPTTAMRRAVLGHSTDADLLALEGRELYWLPGGNLSDSELDLRHIERTLGPMTIRTKRTVDRIAAKYLDP